LKRWALRSSKGFHGYWESKLTKKIDRSVGLQIRYSNVASRSSSVPMKLVFPDPFETLAA